MKNIDKKVVKDFGSEWNEFNHTKINEEDLKSSFESYFKDFPLQDLKDLEGFDMGCGTGRWAKFVAPFVRKLNCIDPSEMALTRAKENLAGFDNCSFQCAATESSNLEPSSQDFGYCLGVLHHIPNTQQALMDCSKLLKKGAPFLLYLYYRFDNKPSWYSKVWATSNIFRKTISKLPFKLKLRVTNLIAFCIYYPLARLSKVAEICGLNVENFPLSDYRNKSFYIMKTDSLDRFGTSLEQRFTRDEIRKMLTTAGFNNITFSDRTPYWVSLAYKE